MPGSRTTRDRVDDQPWCSSSVAVGLQAVEDQIQTELELVGQVAAGAGDVFGGHLGQMGIFVGGECLEGGSWRIGGLVGPVDREAGLLHHESVDVAVQQQGVSRHLDGEAPRPEASEITESTYFKAHDILVGRVWEFDISQTWALGALVLMAIPGLMVFLSLVLTAGAARLTNIVVASLFVPVSIANAVGETWAFYWFGSLVEVALLVAIIRYAWRWPRRVD